MQLVGENAVGFSNKRTLDEKSEEEGVPPVNFGQSSHAASAQGHSAPRIAILLCTYQGQDYLAEQLDSFTTQTYSNWNLHVSDDSSMDDTLAILKRYQANWEKDLLRIHSGPGKGFVANFLSLTCNPAIDADYFAYSDQDDIWESDKLQRAVDWLNTVSGEVPALYCTRTHLVDIAGRHIGYSQLFAKEPGFSNALVQSIAGGNTMVFNRAACNLLREAGDEVDVVSHDWWTYLIVSSCGGRVFYDAYPSLRYRQHGGNMIGANTSWLAQMERVGKLFKNRFRSWNDRNIKALLQLRTRMTTADRQIFDIFTVARNDWLFPRLFGLKRSGVHRQTVLGNIGLVAAAIFKKI